MNSDAVLDYAQFQLSPRRSRCELIVCGGGKTEKLASGFLKPFLTHSKFAEEQATHAVQSIKLEVDKRKNAGTWFNKGTLERFVRFVSTPEVLELVNTFDVEISQLEGAKNIYSQGAGYQLSGDLGEHESAAAADKPKKELLKAIDMRLTAVKQDLATACARASAAGFTFDTVSELHLFSDRFRALRLKEACTKFISLCQRHPELTSRQRSPPPLILPQWKSFDDANIRSSSGSDMSIDEPEVEPAGPFRASISKNINTEPVTQQPSSGQLSAYPPVEKDMMNKANEEPSPNVVASSAEPVRGESRRLSVQDRINLFESKQREQSSSASISGNSSGGGGIHKVVAGKGQHRRLPSDASIEKSVLRRWSGASDMSLYLINSSFSSNKKESGSAAGTPTSSANLQFQFGSKTSEGAGVLTDEATSWPKVGPEDNSTATCSFSSSSSFHAQTRSFLKDKDQTDDALSREDTITTSKAQSPSLEKGHGDSQTVAATFLSRAHQGGASDTSHVIDTQSSSKPPSESVEGAKLEDHTASLAQLNGVSARNVGMKGQAASQIPSITVPVTLSEAESKDQAGEDIIGVKSQAPLITKFRISVAKPKESLDSQFQYKSSMGKEEGISPQRNLPSQSQWKTHNGNLEASYVACKVSSEDACGSQGMQLHRRISPSDQMKKVQWRRDERLPSQGTAAPVLPLKKTKEKEEVVQLYTTPPVEQASEANPFKGNNELNDKLQMKADELEKLFAAHKLRVQGDQTGPSRRSKTLDGQLLKSSERLSEVLADQFFEGSTRSQILSNGAEFDTISLLKMVDNLDSADSGKQTLGVFSPSDDSRGKLYNKYMQKRDAKLREEWLSKRPHREAKMKAIHDSLERSQAEMKAKIAGSGDKRDSVLAHRRADKLRSFNVSSAIKTNQGQMIDPPEGGDNREDLEQVFHGPDRSCSDTSFGNESSTSSKKLISSKSLSLATPRTSAAPIPKPSSKGTHSSSIRPRAQPENPLAHSVPNFSDLRKENAKPGLSLAQPRSLTQSKSAVEEANLVKEEKSKGSHSMRKSLAIPGELKDNSPLSSAGANLEQFANKIHKSSEPKPFLRKGNGIGSSAGAVLAKLKASTNNKSLKGEEDSEVLMESQEDSHCMVKDDEEFDRTAAEENLQATGFPVELDSETGDVLRLPSQDVDDSIDVSSKFNPSTFKMQKSLGESPGLWNSNIHHSFSYANEALDIDASVDSPIGSPASWNCQPLNQMMEPDAVRTRKKWGTTQVPVLVASAPHHSRKDATKGFKRLLKFGWKNKGAEYLVNDWVSTASEGDDHTEDGHELGTRTSDELRKSRMGSVPADDGYNDGDAFPAQVQLLQSSIPNAPANFKLSEDNLSGSSLKAPRSFFSLSSFRSKGSEAKPR